MSTTLAVLRADVQALLRDSADSKWTAAEKNRAINMAIREAYPSWFTDTISDCLVTQTEVVEFTLPTMRRLLTVGLEVVDDTESGTATDGSLNVALGTATLVDDTKSWTADEFLNWHVALYDGTGTGQYALVTTNTATTLSLYTTGYSWTYLVDTTSKYVIKDHPGRTRDYLPILAWRVDQDENPSTLYLTTDSYTKGMYLRLHYLVEPAELSGDTESTAVDREWVTRQACAYLCMMRMEDAPGFETSVPQTLANAYQQLADRLKLTRGMRYPAYSLTKEYEIDGFAYDSEYPF